MQIVLIMPLKTNHLNENLKTPLKTNKNFETISKQNNLKKYKILQTVNRAQLTAPKHISKSVSKSRPEDKTPKKQEPLKELKIIKTEKDKIYEKIKDIEKKLNQLPSLHPLKTPKTPKQQIKTLSSQTPNNGTDAYLIKIQEKKKETELKKQQKLEEKESGLKADIEKLNCEKQKILEVFKLEKQKLFWRKMHELEDRKADRLQNDIFYQEVVKIMIKNHKYPTKTPEFDKRKQQLAQKKKLLSEYSMKVKVESSNDNHIEKNNKKIIEKPKKKIRSLTPNQCKPNYLLVNKKKLLFFKKIIITFFIVTSRK